VRGTEPAGVIGTLSKPFVRRTRPVTSWGHQREGRSVFWEAQIFWTMFNNFKLRPTHFSRGGDEKFCRKSFTPLLPTGCGPLLNNKIWLLQNTGIYFINAQKKPPLNPMGLLDRTQLKNHWWKHYSIGLPDTFCKNTGHFVNSDRSRLHHKRIYGIISITN